METITKLRELNNDILVTIWVGPDIKSSDENIVQVSDIHFRQVGSPKNISPNLSMYVCIFTLISICDN